ncbi:MAG: hypothetical protein ACOH2L_16815 [Devosia sp.]
MASARMTAPHFGGFDMLDVLFVLLGAGMLAALAAYAVALNRL